jgi:hypothetical protein
LFFGVSATSLRNDQDIFPKTSTLDRDKPPLLLMRVGDHLISQLAP